MVATEMAFQFADNGRHVTLMDADIGTGGMSYYLGLRQVRNIRTGLSTVALQGDIRSNSDLGLLLQPVHVSKYDFENGGRILFLPIGDHRRINREYQRGKSSPRSDLDLASLTKKVINGLKDRTDILIVDCRGGIDDESLAVCAAVDDVILIVEPDTTSFQASRHLVDVLADVDLAHKLRGFIINKVYSNPEAVIRNGTSDFGAQFLGAIPFDLSATRAFLVGDVPGPSSIMAVHVRETLSRAYPDIIPVPTHGIWKPRDYDMTNVFTPAASRTGVILALFLLTLGFACSLLVSASRISRYEVIIIILGMSLVGATGSALVPLRVFVRKETGR